MTSYDIGNIKYSQNFQDGHYHEKLVGPNIGMKSFFINRKA